METERILELLIAERDRLERVIIAFGHEPKRRGRPPGSRNIVRAAKRSRGSLTPAGRKAIAEAARRRWAKFRKKTKAARKPQFISSKTQKAA